MQPTVSEIVWHRDEEHGYRFASCYVRGSLNRSYLRGDIPPQYPLPVPLPVPVPPAN